MRRRAFILAIAFLVSSCAPNASGTPRPDVAATPTAAVAAAPSRPAIALDGRALEPCTLGSTLETRATPARCGRLEVPEDPARPGERTIDLRVAVIPATARRPQPDPVFMLAGGPGGAAVDSLPWTAVTFAGIHATRDIVLVDQRGTGGSNAILLDQLPDLSGLVAGEADRKARDWVATQLAGVEADPASYTTSAAMNDLDTVRAALGYDRINLWGGSYGATAAQYYVRQHRDRVRSVVLDGATLLEVPVFERLALNSQAALDAMFARCAADPACGEAYPALRDEFAQVLETLEAGDVTTSITDPATGEPGVIDSAVFTGAVHSALLDASLAAHLPWLFHAAAERRWDEAVLAAQAAGGSDPLSMEYPLMSAVIRCSEGWARYDPQEVARLGAGSYYLDAQLDAANVQATLCRFAPHGVVPADDAVPATSDVPVLFLVGSADPQDPLANIAAAAERFPNSITVVAEGHGHTVSHLGCLPQVVDAFVAAGTADDLDTSCVAAGVPLPPFRLP